MRLLEATELTPNEFVSGWNSAGMKLKMSLLMDGVFQLIDEDVHKIARHNIAVKHIDELLGDNGESFKRQVIDLIESLSLRSTSNGETRQKEKE